MTQRPTSQLLHHAVLLFMALLVFAPLLWALRISLLPAEDIFSPVFRLLPTRWIGFENYGRALRASPLLHYLLNGAVVCIAIIAAQLAVAIPCGYALAKHQFFGRQALWIAVLLGLVVPPPALALPLFIIVAKAGLIDSFAALILPWTISCLGIVLFRQAFLRVPDEVIQAARIDGLGEAELLLRILVPMIAPAIGALMMISLVAHWNDLLWPSVAITSAGKATPPFGVMLFQVQEIGTDHGPLLAGALMIAAPLLIVFIVAQRQLLDNLAWGPAKPSKGATKP